MISHKSSVYKNSCIHLPINPLSKCPTPYYERHFSSAGQSGQNTPKIKMSHTKIYNERESDYCGNGYDSKYIICDEVARENKAFTSMVHFYESIPDYNDVNHLSEKDFYKQLENLKIKHKELKRNNYVYDDAVRPILSNKYQIPQNADNEETDSLYSLHKSIKKNKKKIPNLRRQASSPFSNFTESTEDANKKLSSVSPTLVKFRSKSASPIRSRSTIARPFKMTQREEEKNMGNFLMSNKCLQNDIVKKRKEINMFKANPVPLTSKIPLYQKINEEQEHKNQLAKLNSSIELHSQIKPFRFSTKSSRLPSRCLLNRSESISTPNLTSTLDNVSVPTSDSQITGIGKCKKFKAKPCPKNLFSNYFYHKMWEDEYFRSLNKKIRAEELLKMSSMPPTMAKRLKEVKKTSLENSDQNYHHTKRKIKRKNRSRSLKLKCQEQFKPLSDYNEPKHSSAASNSSTSSSFSGDSPMAIYPVNRLNLAATLRFQTSRKKINELSKPHTDHDSVSPEQHIQRSSWGIKKSPAWKAIYYDGTNKEDISVRLATRRAEQKLRQEEHKISMELMRERVKAAPLLLEGPTYWGSKVGQLSHTCAKVNDEKLFQHQKHLKSLSIQNSRNQSKMSYYSDQPVKINKTRDAQHTKFSNEYEDTGFQ